MLNFETNPLKFKAGVEFSNRQDYIYCVITEGLLDLFDEYTSREEILFFLEVSFKLIEFKIAA